MRKINQAGVELVKSFEGFRERAYKDAAGVWTIGYGHTATVHPGMTVSREKAEALLRADLQVAESAVSRLVTVPLSDNEYAALVSFTFNLGQGALAGSTLLRRLNAGDKPGAAKEFGRWIHAGGRKLNGLLRRRYAEMTLFLRADDD